MKASLTAIPAGLVSATDYETVSRQFMDDNAWHYLIGGAADERTLAANRQAFRQWQVRPRVLADVRGGHTGVELLGRRYAHPLFLAPVAYQRLFHADGELATAQAAAVMEAPMVVSTLASVSFEEIAAGTAGPKWLQLYWQGGRERTLALVRRAEQAGYEALMLTVDAPVAGIRNREQRAGFELPPQVRAVNLEPIAAPAVMPGGSAVFDGLMAMAPTWADLAWLVRNTSLPVLVKGILHADDARLAVEAGAAGLVVSNHGGRVLDGVPPALAVLPAVVAAVNGAVPVLMDGGIRRGGDAFIALALGARAVLVGRPYIHALATAGALGVAHLLRTLREELEITMALCGCANLQAIGRSSLLALRPDVAELEEAAL